MKEVGIGLLRVTGQGRPYAASDRTRVVEYAMRRRREGASVSRVANEIGVARGTLTKWLETSPFEAVEVISIGRAGFAVHGPAGIRIEGLSLEEIAQLIRSLG